MPYCCVPGCGNQSADPSFSKLSFNRIQIKNKDLLNNINLNKEYLSDNYHVCSDHIDFNTDWTYKRCILLGIVPTKLNQIDQNLSNSVNYFNNPETQKLPFTNFKNFIDKKNFYNQNKNLTTNIVDTSTQESKPKDVVQTSNLENTEKEGMVHNCIVYGCKYRKRKNYKKGIAFYSFPLNNKEHINDWLESINKYSLKPVQLSKNSKICQMHFTSDDFIHDHQSKHLKANAVPTLFEITDNSLLSSIKMQQPQLKQQSNTNLIEYSSNSNTDSTSASSISPPPSQQQQQQQQQQQTKSNHGVANLLNLNQQQQPTSNTNQQQQASNFNPYSSQAASLMAAFAAAAAATNTPYNVFNSLLLNQNQTSSSNTTTSKNSSDTFSPSSSKSFNISNLNQQHEEENHNLTNTEDSNIEVDDDDIEKKDQYKTNNLNTNIIIDSANTHNGDTPPMSSSSSCSLSSSNMNTPIKKKGLSDVISKLHKQQTVVKTSSSKSQSDTNNSNSSFNKLKKSNNYDEETDSNDEKSSLINENYDEGENNEDEDYHNDENEYDTDETSSIKQKNTKTASKSESKKLTNANNSQMGNTSLNSIGNSNNGSIETISNSSSTHSNSLLGGDYEMSVNEKLSAIISEAATQNLCPPKPNSQTLSPKSLANEQAKQIQHSKSKTIDLQKLLERANLSQYLNSFIEQGGDDLNQLCEADEQEFKEIVELVGMAAKPLHVKRLRKVIDEHKNSLFNKNDHPTSNSFGANSNPANKSSKTNARQLSGSQVDLLNSNNTQAGNANKNYSTNVAIGLPTPISSIPSSSSSSSASSTSSTSSFSINNLCSNKKIQSNSNLNTTSRTGSPITHKFSSTAQTSSVSSSSLLLPTSNLTSSGIQQTHNSAALAANAAALYPFYQLLNSTSNPGLLGQTQSVVGTNNDSQFNFNLNNSSSTSSVMTAALNHLNQHLLQQQQQQQQHQQRNTSGFFDNNTASSLLNETVKKSKLSFIQESNDSSSKMNLLNNVKAEFDQAEQEINQNNHEDDVNDVNDLEENDNEDNEDNYEEVDEDEEDYEDKDDTDDIEDDYDDENETVKCMKKQKFGSHSSSKSKLTNKQANNSQYASNSLSSSSISVIQSGTIKIEQNEKMIKKNKVIELYTKGERCVRKLSQLTGVPLTTVYRVIGKLKGINYNIPRGNGAGRKTILDSQDREILVEILNAQPRISRKALGKELEKRTGKSIHNSTLNRELCRLRHHGHTFAAVTAAATSSNNHNSSMNSNNSSLSPSYKLNEQPIQNNNYLKHFNSNRKSNMSNMNNNSSLFNTNNSNSSKQNNKPLITNSTSNTSSIKVEKRNLQSNNTKQTSELATSGLKSNQITLDNEYIKLITAEAKRFCSLLTQSDIECKPVINMRPDLSKNIIEICQMSTTHSSTSPVVLQARLEKIQQVVQILVQEYANFNNIDIGKSFYDLCLSEACVQISQIKPTLLTRSDDLITYARRILESCRIVDEYSSSKSRNSNISNKRVLANQNDSLPSSKQIKIEGEYDSQKNQNFLANNFSTQLYTAALALQLQQPNQIGNNVPDLKAYLNKLPFFQSQLSNTHGNNINNQSSLLSNNKTQLKQKIYLNEQQMEQNKKFQDDLKTKLFILNASLNDQGVDKSIGNNSNNEQIKILIEQIQIQLNDAIKKHNDLVNEQVKLKKEEQFFYENQIKINNENENEKEKDDEADDDNDENDDDNNDDDDDDHNYGRYNQTNNIKCKLANANMDGNCNKSLTETGSKLNDNYNDENDEKNEENDNEDTDSNKKYVRSGVELNFRLNKNLEQHDGDDEDEDYSNN